MQTMELIQRNQRQNRLQLLYAMLRLLDNEMDNHQVALAGQQQRGRRRRRRRQMWISFRRRRLFYNLLDGFPGSFSFSEWHGYAR